MAYTLFGHPFISDLDKGPIHGNVWASEMKTDVQALSHAEAYAGEVLSYLLKVVLGKAGNPKYRKEWQTRGLDAKLDMEEIAETMLDIDKNELALMVLDPNIIYLTKVLFHYDRRLSLHKGRFNTGSVYPSPEFIALRLLFLRKIHREEKIQLKNLMDREDLLFDVTVKPSEGDLVATGLYENEMALIREIVKREPRLYHYLGSPFLVKTLYDLGLVAKDVFVNKRIAEANYKKFSCKSFEPSAEQKNVRIAILPSLTKEFLHSDLDSGLPQSGFQPTELYRKAIQSLKREILKKTEALITQKSEWVLGGEEEWTERLVEKIRFCVQERRPFVIHPSNAESAIQDMAQAADIAIILLGKNVYLSLDINKKTDAFPHAPIMYMDIMDIQYSQNEYEIEQISEFIWRKLKPQLN